MRASSSLAVASVILCASAIACHEPTVPVNRESAVALANAAALSVVAPRPPLTYVGEVVNAPKWYKPVHIADMDGDGRPDILVGNWGTNYIEIWEYDLALEKAVYSQSIGPFPYSIHGITTGDVDHDGDLDVLAAIRGYGVYLCLNNGGSWTISNILPVYAWNVQVVDFDHDGNLDVYASLNAGNALLYGNGLGGFAAGAVPSIRSDLINVADFNGDGWLDLIGPDGGIGRMVAYQNLGGRLWSANLGPSNTYPNQLVSNIAQSAADLYGNGNLDQVAVFHDSYGYIPPMSVVIFEGFGAPGSPTWTPRILDVLPQRTLPVGIADLDDDGHMDIFVGGWARFLGFRAYRGDGLGNFTAEDVTFTKGLGNRSSFSVVDFNGDGTSDIVAAMQDTLGLDEPTFNGFAILYRKPMYSCQGFETPMNSSPRTVNKNQALPFKARLVGERFQPLATPPVIQVLFVPAGGGSPVDVTANARFVGQGASGGRFEYGEGTWQYNMKIRNYTAPGAYTVSMLSGDGSKYGLQPSCEATFVVK